MKTEIMQKIIERQDELIEVYKQELDILADDKNTEVITFIGLKKLETKLSDELASLKSHLEAGEEKRCATCKWFKIGHGRCVRCLRNTPWNYEEFLKTSGYVDNWQPR